MFLQVQAVGNVGKEPSLTVTQDGTPVVNFTLAVNRKRAGKDETVWLNCSAWRGLAETIEKYVTKGSTLFIQGELAQRVYTTRDGKHESSLDVVVDKFSFAGGSKQGENKPGPGESEKDAFLPDFPES